DASTAGVVLGQHFEGAGFAGSGSGFDDQVVAGGIGVDDLLLFGGWGEGHGYASPMVLALNGIGLSSPGAGRRPQRCTYSINSSPLMLRARGMGHWPAQSRQSASPTTVGIWGVRC